MAFACLPGCYFHISGVQHSGILLPISGIILFLLLFLTCLQNIHPKFLLLHLNLLFILICCLILPLLPAFALYFAGWHSIISLHNINIFIADSKTANKDKSIKKLFLKALPLSLIAIAGLVGVGYFLRHHAPLFDPLPLLFVFLSLLTLPHLSVMHNLSKNLKV